MSATLVAETMSVTELLALPEDGMERWLLRGQLREKPMTRRNRWHARTEARIAQLLANWKDAQPEPRGAVLSGEAGCRLRRDPDTVVGIDVVYLAPDLAARDPDDTTIIDGVPTLAVEILSPYDTEEETNEKVDEYLAAGVPLVWLVDPHLETVTVLRPGAPAEMFNIRHELTAEPHLPGFRVPVLAIFRS